MACLGFCGWSACLINYSLCKTDILNSVLPALPDTQRHIEDVQSYPTGQGWTQDLPTCPPLSSLSCLSALHLVSSRPAHLGVASPSMSSSSWLLETLQGSSEKPATLTYCELSFSLHFFVGQRWFLASWLTVRFYCCLAFPQNCTQ